MTDAAELVWDDPDRRVFNISHNGEAVTVASLVYDGETVLLRVETDRLTKLVDVLEAAIEWADSRGAAVRETTEPGKFWAQLAEAESRLAAAVRDAKAAGMRKA